LGPTDGGATRRPVAAGVPGVAAVGPAAGFGGLLRACRERALLSQEQLAERAGLSARTIRELEAGRVRRPRGATVRLLAHALGLQGSLHQAFVAAARSGDAVPRGGREGGLEGSKLVVVAVAVELRVGCCGRCRTGGRQETG
jgi:DNA-binding XRE family transcriptional regulator